VIEMARVVLFMSQPLFEDVEQLRERLGYKNRSAWLEYLISRGLEVVRREKGMEEVIGNAPALAGAEA